MTIRAPVLFFLSALLALCSLTYELILAQILSATLGGTLLRYSTVIGLFTLSLGMGSLLFGLRRNRGWNLMRTLFIAEFLLAVLGLVSPFFIVFLEPFRLHSELPLLFEFLFYLPVALIGLLSGFELPLLIAFCSHRGQEFRVLSADYLGMFAGSLLVPLFLYPRFGPFVGSLWVSLLNLTGAALIFFEIPAPRPRSFFVLLVLLGICLCFALVSQGLWLDWIRQWFITSF